MPKYVGANIKNEILTYFVIRGEDKKHLKREDLLVTRKAWKQWKCKLVRDFVHKKITPFAKYLQISKEEWAEFVLFNAAN
jgi:hypothetical protein